MREPNNAQQQRHKHVQSTGVRRKKTSGVVTMTTNQETQHVTFA